MGCFYRRYYFNRPRRDAGSCVLKKPGLVPEFLQRISGWFLNKKEQVMNKVILVTLVGLGFIVSGCGNKPEQTASGQTGTLASAVSEVKTSATAAAGQTQQSVQQTASDLAKKAQTLLAQAKKYLDEGKFNEAITVAQNILSFDPKNIDAQKIIETAKAKLQALAEQKVGELKTGLMDKMGTMGK
jgi:hypothetical protein